jgi:hypothetical protein
MTKPIPDKAEVAVEYPDKLGGLKRSTQHFISDARDGVDGDGAKIWSRLRCGG